jgi:hypothetical protein
MSFGLLDLEHDLAEGLVLLNEAMPFRGLG